MRRDLRQAFTVFCMLVALLFILAIYGYSTGAWAATLMCSDPSWEAPARGEMPQHHDSDCGKNDKCSPSYLTYQGKPFFLSGNFTLSASCIDTKGCRHILYRTIFDCLSTRQGAPGGYCSRQLWDENAIVEQRFLTVPHGMAGADCEWLPGEQN